MDFCNTNISDFGCWHCCLRQTTHHSKNMFWCFIMVQHQTSDSMLFHYCVYSYFKWHCWQGTCFLQNFWWHFLYNSMYFTLRVNLHMSDVPWIGGTVLPHACYTIKDTLCIYGKAISPFNLCYPPYDVVGSSQMSAYLPNCMVPHNRS